MPQTESPRPLETPQQAASSRSETGNVPLVLPNGNMPEATWRIGNLVQGCPGSAFRFLARVNRLKHGDL